MDDRIERALFAVDEILTSYNEMKKIYKRTATDDMTMTEVSRY